MLGLFHPCLNDPNSYLKPVSTSKWLVLSILVSSITNIHQKIPQKVICAFCIQMFLICFFQVVLLGVFSYDIMMREKISAPASHDLQSKNMVHFALLIHFAEPGFACTATKDLGYNHFPGNTYCMFLHARHSISHCVYCVT